MKPQETQPFECRNPVESRTLPAGTEGHLNTLIRPQKILHKISYKDYNLNVIYLNLEMLSKCAECDHLLVSDEVEYLYKGKSYCDDCYRAVKKLEGAAQRNK